MIWFELLPLLHDEPHVVPIHPVQLHHKEELLHSQVYFEFPINDLL